MISFEHASKIFHEPFLELIHRAAVIHREHHDPRMVQVSSLLSLQTGGCSGDCAYCAQSSRNKTKMPKAMITDVEAVLEAARRAKGFGSSRFCMGTSGIRPVRAVFEMACKLVREIKKLGMETCLTMGQLNEDEVVELKNAGLDFYNHNVDTSPEYYDKIITTRTLGERLQTIALLQKHGIKICSGGILGLGETNDDRIRMLVLLANLEPPPESVPINRLIRIPGTPLEDAPDVDPFDFVRTIALTRILMPRSIVRISAGRETMSDELQALCFLAGASSIFMGEKLLTAENAEIDRDLHLLRRLGLRTSGDK